MIVSPRRTRARLRKPALPRHLPPPNAMHKHALMMRVLAGLRLRWRTSSRRVGQVAVTSALLLLPLVASFLEPNTAQAAVHHAAATQAQAQANAARMAPDLSSQALSQSSWKATPASTTTTASDGKKRTPGEQPDL